MVKTLKINGINKQLWRDFFPFYFFVCGEVGLSLLPDHFETLVLTVSVCFLFFKLQNLRSYIDDCNCLLLELLFTYGFKRAL